MIHAQIDVKRQKLLGFVQLLEAGQIQLWTRQRRRDVRDELLIFKRLQDVPGQRLER